MEVSPEAAEVVHLAIFDHELIGDLTERLRAKCLGKPALGDCLQKDLSVNETGARAVHFLALTQHSLPVAAVVAGVGRDTGRLAAHALARWRRGVPLTTILNLFPHRLHHCLAGGESRVLATGHRVGSLRKGVRGDES